MERYRITSDAALYFCTFSVVDWLPVFVGESSTNVVFESLRFCRDEHRLRIDSYVVMPTHLHMIVFDAEFDSNKLNDCLIQFRKFTGRKLVELCRQSMPQSFDKTFKLAAGDDRQHRFWQATRHPESITTERFHKQERDYLHDNPGRKGLVIDPSHWRWSSARWYASGEGCDVPITPAEW